MADPGGVSVPEGEAEGVTELDKVPVDWAKTKAWGWGGYYARIFLNVEGREAQGTVRKSDYEDVGDELKSRLLSIRDPDGRLMDTRVYKPEELYGECHGDPPDLMVYLDDLYWRSAGTLGHDSLYLSENDTGPDDSVHAMDGVFVLYDPQRSLGRRIARVSIYDVAPTLLDLMGEDVVEGMGGQVRRDILA